jgi:hypothetical protein
MPCYRCGTRQVDPDRGASPWKRGVRADAQVLICPECQSGRDWAADLDRCAVCSGVRLIRRLGEVECKNCGHVRAPAPQAADDAGTGLAAGLGAQASDQPARAGDQPAPAGGTAPGLAEEVARALDRVLAGHRVPH